MLKIGSLVEFNNPATQKKVSGQFGPADTVFIVVKVDTFYPGYVEVLAPNSRKKRLINQSYLKKLG